MSTSIAIIGAGAIGHALATNFARAGVDVLIANRAGPASLAKVAALGASVHASTMEQALAADIVIFAIPFTAIKEAMQQAPAWQARIVVDATNAIDFPAFTPTDLGGRASTHVVADAVPGARVVKAFNTLPAAYLAADPAQGDRKRVLFVSGDDAAANRDVAALIERLGFAATVLGKIEEGGRLQQFGGVLTNLDLGLRPLAR
jgi:predicted dinucleotide-binding enzyme